MLDLPSAHYAGYYPYFATFTKLSSREYAQFFQFAEKANTLHGDEDIALMSLVGHPRPVNPRPGLAAMAAQRGWPVLRVTGPDGRTRARSLRTVASVGWSALMRYAASTTLRRE